MRYRPRDQRHLDPELFEKRSQVNPFFERIYHYPDWIIPSYDPLRFQEKWNRVIANAAKTHVEIGCGSGISLLHYSLQFPQDAFLGFELRYKRLVNAAKKLKKYQRANVVLVKDKGEYLTDYLSERSIDFLYVFFPDPWAKPDQHKHRLLNKDFLKRIHPLFRAGGSLFLKTDHRHYFDMAAAAVEHLPKEYQLAEYTTDLHQSPYDATNVETEFEGLFRSKGNLPIFYFKANLLNTIPS